ncbi:CBN-TTR-2 protein [Caenorhabditis brenneri]|uniref:CBN-TTR-2 protein n=1 Tax=Caenorhabditis brenneri TaxID=135651 RepID=G0MKE5_CAEBE|nr:CBN-TTR-2 protein [Caenorhabditis brenneri]
MVKFVLIGLLLVGSAASLDLIGRTQSAAVKGKLMCEGKPASGVKVKLMESDNSFGPGFLDSDDKMASGKSDPSGGFNLSGSTKELTGIEAYLAVFHDCKDGITPCQRVFRVNIPKSYTNSGSSAKQTYDAGVIELAGKYPGETRSCLN